MPAIHTRTHGIARGDTPHRPETEQMNIFVTNEQDIFKISRRSLIRFLAQMAENLQRSDSATTWGELSLVLTDNAGIRQINTGFLHVTDATDVIAFRYAPVPGDRKYASGEIFVNVERAVETGYLYGGSSRELALYIAHGCDHLAGQSDSTTAGYTRMRRRELRWLKRAAADGLLRLPLLHDTGRRHPGIR